VLTDVGSTKAEILTALLRARTGASVIAGHPMAGNERAGLDGVDPRLFEQRPWVLIPASGTPEAARTRLERLVRGVGSRPLWMSDPLEHDLRVARISHIPYLLAYALARQPDDTLRVCGNSFRDATRVALSDVDMVLDFLLTNRGPIRRAAREMRGRFDELVDLLRRGDEQRLRRRLEESRARRAKV
jgi:prephenate dehydrogenase